MAFVREGVWHIWIGFDHVLFLLSLLPAVWLRGSGRWELVPRFGSALWEVFRVVTAFTVAHSITLNLAALELVSLPSRLVESVIAASVLLAALNNLFPLVSGRRWLMAFGFGLIHGFGFASVLTDLGLPQGALISSLFGFNLGVEMNGAARHRRHFSAAGLRNAQDPLLCACRVCRWIRAGDHALGGLVDGTGIQLRLLA